jgi:hypothetical protein
MVRESRLVVGCGVTGSAKRRVDFRTLALGILWTRPVRWNLD